jgi:hypothetical protein
VGNLLLKCEFEKETFSLGLVSVSINMSLLCRVGYQTLLERNHPRISTMVVPFLLIMPPPTFILSIKSRYVLGKRSKPKLQSFRADNMPFNSKEFKSDLVTKGQTLSLSGVGAHHQNGVAERAIQTVTQWARSMLLHQVLHWPDQAQLDLWPFALEHAVYLWNHLPKKDSLIAPVELFTGAVFLTIMITSLAPMCGDVQLMFSIYSFKMGRNSPSGTHARVEACLLASLLLTPPRWDAS